MTRPRGPGRCRPTALRSGAPARTPCRRVRRSRPHRPSRSWCRAAPAASRHGAYRPARGGVDHLDHHHVLVAVQRDPPEDTRLVTVDRLRAGFGEVSVVAVELQHHAAQFCVLLLAYPLRGQGVQLLQELRGHRHAAPGVQGETVTVGERRAVPAVEPARLVPVQRLRPLADHHGALVGPPPARVPGHFRQPVEPVAPAVECGEPGRVVLAQHRVEQHQPDVGLVLGALREVRDDTGPDPLGECRGGLPELSARGGPQRGPARRTQFVVHPAALLGPGPGPYLVTHRAPGVDELLHGLHSGPGRVDPDDPLRLGESCAAVGEPQPVLGRGPVGRAGRRCHGPP